MCLMVKAKCIRNTYKNGDYRIFNWSPIKNYKDGDKLKLSNYFTFSTKGNDTYIDENKEYELELEEISSDAKWGGTYKIVSCPSIMKLDLEKMTIEQKKEILLDCTSSERIANNILTAYPNFIELILTEGKESIDIKKIKGVGEVYLNCYSRNLIEKYKYYAILQKFKEYKLDISDCKALIATFKDENGIDSMLKENPYMVNIECLGRSFEYSDRIIMGLREDLRVSEQRCAYLILSVLQKNEMNGSTRLNGNDLYYYILNEYNVPELEPLIVPTAKENPLFFYDEESKDLSIMATYSAECQISNFVKNKIENSKVLDIDWEKYTSTKDGFKMSEKQSMALKMFCENNFMILAGYSGSGKTTSLKGIINLMEDSGLTYTLLAPTGKASKRMTESTNRPSSTIHRQVLRNGHISTDVLIVDETSMVDLNTFIMMLNAIDNEDIRVVLVGDNAQLMPVGIGCIFNDLINSGVVPMIMLDEVFRYDTDGGLFVATNIRQGKPFFDSDKVTKIGNTYSICDNYKFIQTDDILSTIVSEYNKLISKGVKPNEILCLSPFNVGDEGSYRINNAIQVEVNPPKPNGLYLSRKIDNSKTEVVFRLGDRVLNKKNDYQSLPLESYNLIEESNGLLTENDVETTSIFNGQDGVIRDIDDKKIVAQFDEELIVINKAKLNNMLLSYCISVHSSQGSEAKYVLNVVSPNHKRMLNRNLLYVADTRAKVLQIDIGDMGTFNDALIIDGNLERNTWLKELLVVD